MLNIRQQFTGIEYMLIHLANTYGLDKKTFQIRIDWAKDAYLNSSLAELEPTAESPNQFAQCWREIAKVRSGEPTGLLVELDATSSFLQFMTALSGCSISAHSCNMLDPDVRIDAYQILIDIVQTAMPHLTLTRLQAKDLFMKSTAYGSSNIPKNIFPDEDDLNTYYEVMAREFPGVSMVREELLNLWDETAFYHTCRMPDQHVFHVPVTVPIVGSGARIEIAEVAPYNAGRAKSVTYLHDAHMPSSRNTPILANLIQGLDAWMVRAVRESCYEEGVNIVTIHDGFRSHPNDMGVVRYWYREHMARLTEMDFLRSLIKDLKGVDIPPRAVDKILVDSIRNSCYMLS